MLSEKLRAALDNLLPDAGSDESYLLHGQSLRDAAVLIAFTDRPDPGVILTQRPQWLRSHAGQVAFPGGKIDPGDADAVDAALREAEEEIGLHRRDVAVAGTTDAYRSGSGQPGPSYWQNRADYQIHATLDPKAHSLAGEEAIAYTNNSPDTLDVLWLQLDQNMYRPNSRSHAADGASPRRGGTTGRTGRRWCS